MSPRSFFALLAVTVVALVVAAVLIVTDSGGDNVPNVAGDPMFPALAEHVEDIGEIVIETKSYRLDLRNVDGRWVAANLGNYPIVPDAIAQIVAALSQMTIVEDKTANPDWYHFIGVDDPTADLPAGVTPGVHITAVATNGDVLADAIFGNASASVGYARDGGSFVRRAGEAQAWLVTGGINVPGFQQDWFGQLLSIPGTQIARITIFLGEDMVLDAEKVDLATGDYELAYLAPSLGPAGSTANDNGLRGVGQGVVSTSFEGVRSADSVTFADDARMVRFTTTSGLQLDVKIGEADGEIWVTYNASAQDGGDAAAEAAALNARAVGWAFKLVSYRTSALMRDLTTLFDPPAPAEEAPPAAPLPILPLLPGP